MEKPLRVVVGAGSLALLVLVLALVLAIPLALSQSSAVTLQEYNLLANPGMEVYDPPYGQYDGVDCQVATGWQRFWYGGPEPGWMDARVFADSHLGTGWVERIEGEKCQVVVSTEPYTAGLLQQVTGLTPGVGYGFHAAMLTIFQSSALPATDGTMIKQVGMDPTGGIDPQAPTVVWSEPDAHDQGPWAVKLRTSVYAQGPTMTVFVRVESLYPAGDPPFLNLSLLDSAILAQTPVVTATSPAASTELAFQVGWDNAVPALGLDRLRKYDVQWLDESEGVWHDWIVGTTDVFAATFQGERGHAYRFRARVSRKYLNGALLYSPYRPEGDTRTVVAGPELAGRVYTHDGMSVSGATVAISGTSYVATTGPDGRYDLDVLAWPDPQVVTVGHPTLLAPAPVYDVTFGLTERAVLTWTLRPPDDAVSNGGFEAGLAGWLPSTHPGGAPATVTEPVHSGRGALVLGSAAPVRATVGVSQTWAMANTWEPALSFWYQPEGIDGDDTFHVVLTVVTQTVGSAQPVTTTQHFTPDLDFQGWRHQWYYPGPSDAALTGTVTARLVALHAGEGAATAIYLDEVSFGATAGGPHKLYLPLVLR